MNQVTPPEKLRCIRDLNDAFRRTGQGGKVVATKGIMALPEAIIAVIVLEVSHFDAFTDENDPHNEHDIGSFYVREQKILWKIDYYGPDMRYGSDDPGDPTKTRRVLTVMLEEEY